MSVFRETLHQGFVTELAIDRLIHRQKSRHQDIILFESGLFGRVLGLDSIIQTTQADEYIYHEMMIHPAFYAHSQVRDILIIGGGDGGCARESLRHCGVKVTMVEIDKTVVDLCRQHLPGHSQGAFDNPDFNFIQDDGANFVATTNRCFDLIIIDSTDPVGPAEVLFTSKFYQDCHRCLRPGGVMIAQNGVPFFQHDTLDNTQRSLANIFADVACFSAAVPSYVGGTMAFSWASDQPGLYNSLVKPLPSLRYYNEAIHQAAFAIPNDMADLTL